MNIEKENGKNPFSFLNKTNLAGIRGGRKY